MTGTAGAEGPGVLAFNKPKGVVVSRRDDRGRRTVYDLLPRWAREKDWAPVGRLDRDSRGLLLFTRDGKLVELLTRPGVCTKTYEVWVRGRVTEEHVARMTEGVSTPAGPLRALRVERRGGAGPKTRLVVELDEGKNRHIRRMFGALRDPERGTPLKVLDLRRVSVGPVRLDVASGKWRRLSYAEVQALVRLSADAQAGACRPGD